MQIDKRKVLANLKKDLKAAEIIKKQWDGRIVKVVASHMVMKLRVRVR